MLHGFGTTGDMWAPVASALVDTHTVIVPDLRGLGLSSKPSGGHDKRTQSGDIVHALDALGVEQVDLVTHDIGNMVGYAFAAAHPDRVRRFALIDGASSASNAISSARGKGRRDVRLRAR